MDILNIISRIVVTKLRTTDEEGAGNAKILNLALEIINLKL